MLDCYATCELNARKVLVYLDFACRYFLIGVVWMDERMTRVRIPADAMFLPRPTCLNDSPPLSVCSLVVRISASHSYPIPFVQWKKSKKARHGPRSTDEAAGRSLAWQAALLGLGPASAALWRSQHAQINLISAHDQNKRVILCPPSSPTGTVRAFGLRGTPPCSPGSPSTGPTIINTPVEDSTYSLHLPSL